MALSTSSPSAYHGWYRMCGNSPSIATPGRMLISLSATPYLSTPVSEQVDASRDLRRRGPISQTQGVSSPEPSRVSPGGALSAKMSTLARHGTGPEMTLRHELHRRG